MTEPISFELPRQNVTIVGSFNPAIFHPSWVREHVPQIRDEIQTLMPAEGGPPLCHADELYWTVTPERLVAYGPPRQTGGVVATILTTLCHTPLRAAGVNFLFKGKAPRERCGPWRIAVSVEDTSALLRGSPGELALSQAVQREDGVRVTLKLVWPSEEPEVVLDLNYHLAARESRNEARAKELAAHAERASEFAADAERISRELLHG